MCTGHVHRYRDATGGTASPQLGLAHRPVQALLDGQPGSLLSPLSGAYLGAARRELDPTPPAPEPLRGGTRYRISYGHATDTPTVPTMVRITAIRKAKHASATSAVRTVDCEIRKLADKNSKPSAISSR